MKKILFIAALFSVACAALVAQTTTPRTGTGKNYWPGKLNFAYGTLTDAAGNDTLSVTPNAFKTVYKLAGTDSVSISLVATSAFLSDEATILLSNASGVKKVKFVGSVYTLGTDGNITTNSGKGACITFIFDGAKWVEKGRSLQ